MFYSVLCMGVLPAIISVQHVHAVSLESRSPGTEGTATCELPCGCWKLNQGPLEEQPILIITEPSLWLLNNYRKARSYQRDAYILSHSFWESVVARRWDSWPRTSAFRKQRWMLALSSLSPFVLKIKTFTSFYCVYVWLCVRMCTYIRVSTEDIGSPGATGWLWAAWCGH